MPPINLLIKPASGMCNMSCDYCFYCDVAEKRKQASYGFMSENCLKNVLRKTIPRAEHFCTIAYQGGEPTLIGIDFFRKSLEFQKKYNKNNIRIDNALQTNGYNLNDEWCEFFKDNHFLIGLSVDGTKDMHDTYRHNQNGEGTYDSVLKSAQMMDKHGVDYNILTVVNSKTATDIEKIYYHYKQMGWQFQQYIACLDPLEDIRGQKAYSLTPEMYGRFLIELFNLWYKDLKKRKQPYIRQFENYLSILAGRGAESCDQNGVCGLQNVVEADGSVYPCDFYVLDEYRLGNLNEVSLTDIYEKRKEIKFIERSYNHSDACKQCDYFRICRGGCQRSRVKDLQTGSYQNYFCLSYRMFFEACYDRLLQIAIM